MNAAERPNELEREALHKLLEGEHPSLERLRRQLAGAEVVRRERTGTGFVTRLAVPDGAARLGDGKPFQILDVCGEIAGVGTEASFILFVEQGALARLECQTLDDTWPASPRLERLFYMRPKSEGSADLVEAPARDLGWALAGAGAALKEEEMTIPRNTELDPGATQDIGAVAARLTGRRRLGGDGDETRAVPEPVPARAAAVEPAAAPEPDPPDAEPAAGPKPASAEPDPPAAVPAPPAALPGEAASPPPLSLSNSRTMALVAVSAVLATLLGIGLVAMLVVAGDRPGTPAAPSGVPSRLPGDLLLEVIMTLAVAGAAGACLANLSDLFRQSRQPESLPARQEAFFYLRPLVGAFTALFAFLVVSTAVFAFTAGTAADGWAAPPARTAYVALSLLVGFGTYEVLDRLKEILRALFPKPS